MRTQLRVVLASAVILSLSAASAEAQRRSGNTNPTRFEAYFASAFGGNLKFENGGSVDMDPGVGGGIRFLFPLSSMVSLGPTFEATGLRVERQNDRTPYLDFGAALRIGGSPFRAPVELYGLAPLGFTVAVADPDARVGLNLGALFGVQWRFSTRAGLFCELGWRRHQVWDDGAHTAIDQAAMNFGIAAMLR